MHRSWLLTRGSTQAVLCLLLSAGGVLAAEAGSGQLSNSLLNNELPFPDSFFAQSIKPVVARLKGQVTVNQEVKQAKAQPGAGPSAGSPIRLTRAIPPSIEPAAMTAATPAVINKGAASTDVVSMSPAPTAPPVVPALAGAATLSAAADASPFSQQLNDLLSAAEKQNPEWQKYSEAVDHYGDWKRRLGERTHDMINYSILFKGVSPSSEGGDIILGEKSKLKGLASAKFLRQKASDEAELQLTSAVLQLAGGLGNPDSNEGQSQVTESLQEITKLSGKEAADRTNALLSQWRLKAGEAKAGVNKPLWTVADGKAHVEEVLGAAAASDAVVADIRDDVHHFNQHSQGSMAADRIARTALSAASCTPNLIGPGPAQVVLFTYITVSGGTEQDKLLRELYIDKRLSSRVNLLSEQAHLALYNYQVGVLTQNSLLMDCSKQLLGRLCGAASAGKLLASNGQLQAGERQSVSARP